MVKILNNSRLRRRLVLLGAWLIGFTTTNAQKALTLTLESCYELAKANYPLIRQQGLIDLSAHYALSNAAKGKLPRLSLAGQASYQSDVPQIPLNLPNLKPLDKDQYRLYADIAHPLNNLWTVNYQQELIRANTLVEEQQLAVDLYQLKERIHQLYFGILLQDAQLKLTAILMQDILLGIARNKVAIANGVLLRSSADVLLAESLSMEQRLTEQRASRKAYVAMLALFVNQDLNENTIFQEPKSTQLSSLIKRPELQLFELQMQSYTHQRRLLDLQNLPQLHLFLQGGYGRPGLNMLDNSFNLFYTTGLRLNWNISNLYTAKQDKQLLGINQKALRIQQETFLFNTEIKLQEQRQELSKLEELILGDAAIIQLREGVVSRARTALEYGSITEVEYLQNVHAADQARMNNAWHYIQLLRAQQLISNTVGQ